MHQTIGPLIIALSSIALTREEKQLLSHPLICGVVLFSRNYADRLQLKNLCQEIRDTMQRPCLIAVDQEGGRVQRFKHEFSRLPALSSFGTAYDQCRDEAIQASKRHAVIMATELLATGIDLSFAPVVDLDRNLNTVVGDRAFHSDPEVVGQLAQWYIAGMREAGMASVLKHFPGHGHVTTDSHHEVPRDEREYHQIAASDLMPFKMLVTHAPAIMTSHILFPKVDPEIVTYSKKWLQEILRGELQFSGLVISDDLNMKGAIDTSFVDRFKKAKEAGCDFVLLCNNAEAVQEVLEHINYADYCMPVEKLRPLQGRLP